MYLGLGLMAGAGILGALGGSSTQAMVADLVHPERREAAWGFLAILNPAMVTFFQL